MTIEAPADLSAECPHCRKPPALCVCDGVAPVDNHIEVLILQHPQEQDRALGTARLTALQLKSAQLKVGLSWPNLGKILGRPVDPQRWAVLYLGSTSAAEIAPERELVLVDRKGAPERNQDAALREIEGIVLLDGTWSQAKALWWRNPWMLKCRRIVLNPREPSRYGKVRREPRRDALSTIESAALLLSRLEHRPEIESALTDTFERMLARVRASGQTFARPAGRRGGSRRRDGRHRRRA
ncbi:MAG TPA: tRNA-uridine aminocarboxypropyltransferase [Xanthobacteraceae bacterium]|nr:tRNA-uridine aminocarboxypropyltransferase [Xanthobacteraceae bacterium]